MAAEKSGPGEGAAEPPVRLRPPKSNEELYARFVAVEDRSLEVYTRLGQVLASEGRIEKKLDDMEGRINRKISAIDDRVRALEGEEPREKMPSKHDLEKYKDEMSDAVDAIRKTAEDIQETAEEIKTNPAIIIPNDIQRRPRNSIPVSIKAAVGGSVFEVIKLTIAGGLGIGLWEIIKAILKLLK